MSRDEIDQENPLTDMETLFVHHFARGVPRVKAATLAGFKDPSNEPSRLLRRSRVLEALDRETGRILRCELRPLAVSRLKAVLEDDKVGGTTLINAVKLALATDAPAPGGPGSGRSLEDMSLEELQEASASITRKMAKAAAHDATQAAQKGEDRDGLARAGLLN